MELSEIFQPGLRSLFNYAKTSRDGNHLEIKVEDNSFLVILPRELDVTKYPTLKTVESASVQVCGDETKEGYVTSCDQLYRALGGLDITSLKYEQWFQPNCVLGSAIVATGQSLSSLEVNIRVHLGDASDLLGPFQQADRLRSIKLRLPLDDINFKEEDAISWANSILECPNLEEVFLLFEHDDPVGSYDDKFIVISMAKDLCERGKLRRLFLERHFFEDNHSMASFLACLKNNNTLETLALTEIESEHKNVTIFKRQDLEVLQNASLRDLRITCTLSEANLLVDALKASSSIKRLEMFLPYEIDPDEDSPPQNAEESLYVSTIQISRLMTGFLSVVEEDNKVLEGLVVQTTQPNCERFLVGLDPLLKFYLRLNKEGHRKKLLDVGSQPTPQDWVAALVAHNDDVKSIFFFLSKNPVWFGLKPNTTRKRKRV